MLSGVRVEIKRRGIRHIASGTIRNDRDVIAYLVLIRVTFERIKRITDGNVRRPRDAAIGAERIKQLGVSVICSVARIEPDRVDSTVRCHRQRAKPMPFVVVDGVVVNSVRCAKG